VARIAGVDLPRNKRMEVALTYIFGIGPSASKKILAEANIDPNKKSDALLEADWAKSGISWIVPIAWKVTCAVKSA